MTVTVPQRKLVMFITVGLLDHISGGSSSSGGRYQHNFAMDMESLARIFRQDLANTMPRSCTEPACILLIHAKVL